ncbi:MAG: hypothetical protein AAGF74_11225 [Pseudomonadota bacterium]
MTLEKLLIFGFALALVTAVTVSATSMVKDRKSEGGSYKTEVEGLVQKTTP